MRRPAAAHFLYTRQFHWSNARIATHSEQSRHTPSLQPLAVLQRDPKGSAMMSVGNCVEPDLTRAPATCHASPNLSPLSTLRCSPCTVVRLSLRVPPSRAFGAAERRQAAPSRRCHARPHIPRSLARVLCAPHPAFIDALELIDCIHTGGSSIHRRRPPSSIHRHPPSIAPDARLLSSGRWLACTGQTF
jgi:hypothetical protein